MEQVLIWSVGQLQSKERWLKKRLNNRYTIVKMEVLFMHICGKITVVPDLPERIGRLEELSYNLWWSWNPNALKLFEQIEPTLWEHCKHNPVYFLHRVSHALLKNKCEDNSYLELYDSVIHAFDTYMNAADTWFVNHFAEKADKQIVYLSAEYGLHETLPVYSGGLGVLSGDHCKSASDLGLPFTAIGLFYKQGYFVQHLSTEGWQESKFTKLNIDKLPIQPAKDKEGKEIVISVDFPGREVFAKIWQVNVGRICIYMLDTDIPSNNPNDRSITSILYGGDQEMRISQEIILGIGGIKLLEAVGIEPTIYHLNEGHSAFCTLEVMRRLIQQKGLSFEHAREVVAASTVFTTHTPVPAGSDRFPLFLMDKYFSQFWPFLGIDRDRFMQLGLCPNCHDVFNMTVLALKIAGLRNAVSKLHGNVSRNIFHNVWQDIPEEEVPISSITNGVHTTTWLNPDLKELFDQYLGADWTKYIEDNKMWKKIHAIPDKDLWSQHLSNKKEMITFIRNRLKTQKIRNGESQRKIDAIEQWLNPEALTIGFARRFATYKRATLIFRDIERLLAIMNKPTMPVQIIFAGKAHPADYQGQELIKNIYDMANRKEFRGKIVLVENYDMNLARHMISGVDIWLNTPRRPLEASGTSGQKVSLNGGINFSILDGWWTEGYNGFNGWSIGYETHYADPHHQDDVDAQSLYNILEDQIVPLYYERNEDNLPTNWAKVMKASIETCAPVFSTARMVQDYTKDLYVVAMNKKEEVMQNSYALARELSNWKSKLKSSWQHVKILPDQMLNMNAHKKIPAGHPVALHTSVQLGSISPDNVRVEVYYGKIAEDGTLEYPEIATMSVHNQQHEGTYAYTANVHLETGGEYGYTFRVLPYRPELISEHDLGLIKWADISENALHKN